jgi:hypothetical protein
VSLDADLPHLDPHPGIDTGVTTAHAMHYPLDTRVDAVRPERRIMLGYIGHNWRGAVAFRWGIDAFDGRESIELPAAVGGWTIETTMPRAVVSYASSLADEPDTYTDPDLADIEAERHFRRAS